MAQQSINIGSGPNTKDGDPIREAFRKTDENFTELYSGYTGSAVGNGYTGSAGSIGYTGSRGYTGSSSIPLGTKTSNSIGTPGDTSYDTNYFYICIGTNSWKRIALGTIT